MLLRQVIELFDLLDTPAANGTTVTDLFKERGNVEVTVENVKGDEGDTDCVTILIKGSEGKSIGGSAPTLGIIHHRNPYLPGCPNSGAFSCTIHGFTNRHDNEQRERSSS